MRKLKPLVWGALGLLVAYMAAKNMPELVRYVRISRM